MKRVHLLVCFFAAAGVLVVGSGYSQDTKKEAQPPAGKAALPTGFGKLGITGDQKKKILEVVSVYQAKIGVLKDQIDQLKKDEYVEAFKLLNDDQKATLKKIAAEKTDPTNADKKDEKKKGGV